jgi:ADP-ribosylglycohydrolase
MTAAVLLGADTDTVAAIAGGILGDRVDLSLTCNLLQRSIVNGRWL